jgi:amino acid permease
MEERDGAALVRGTHILVNVNNGEEEHVEDKSHAKTSWIGITMIILASFVGTGVLSLGFAAAAIGWVPVISMILVCGAGAGYSGVLYYRLYKVIPTAKVLADVGHYAYGPSGERFVRAVAYSFIGGVVVVFHLTTASAFANIFYDSGICTVFWSVFGGVFALVLSQFRDVHEIGGLAVFGTISIFVPVIVVFSVLISNGHRVDAQMHDDVNSYDDKTTLLASVNGFNQFATFGVGLMDVVFAFSGQVIFLELISGMAQPTDFKKSVGVSTMVMGCTYITVASLAYHFVGTSGLIGGDPITSALDNGPTLRVVNSFLVCHVIVAYVIETNMLARGILKIWDMETAIDGDTPHDRFVWFATTASIVLGAFILSNLIPFFSDIMGLLGSLCSILLTYTIPLVCARKLVPMTPFEYTATSFLVPFSVVAAIFGTFCAVVDIVDKMDVSTPPFSC